MAWSADLEYSQSIQEVGAGNTTPSHLEVIAVC